MSRKSIEPRAVGVHFDGDLRRALIDAAVVGLDDVGADSLSLRDVARRAGVSHAAPAHHFGDKAGLLTAVAVEAFHLFVEHLGAALVRNARKKPVDQLAALGRAYAEFADLHPGHFEVMFRPGIIRSNDPDYEAASADAFEALRAHVEACQLAGWRPEEDNRALSVAAWALAHGLSALRSQGSLARHYPNDSLDSVVKIAATLLSQPVHR
jgi:AcrR family transcriptional regulator